MGDSAAEDTKVNMEKFLKKLDALISGEVPTFTFILDDPAGNSYLQVCIACVCIYVCKDMWLQAC